MSHNQFHRILLIGRPSVPGVTESLLTIRAHLLSLGTTVFTEENAPHELDLILVVGGDGSLLNAVPRALEHQLPIVGVHRGRLGFLTDISPQDLEQITQVIQGEYQQEKRALLEATLMYQEKTLASLVALNEIVLLPGDVAQMTQFDIYIDEQFVCQQRADGLIIATATGSTAYALSGGGPILQPGLKANVLVPMFSHTLSSRPIVVDDQKSISLRIDRINTHPPYVSNDGIQRIALPIGGEVRIQPHHKTLTLIHPKSYNYYATLREKLGWQQQAQRKPC